MSLKRILLFPLIILISCSSLENTKKKKLKVEEITRLNNDVFFEYDCFQKNSPVYPFETEKSLFSKITKEFFRCKGNHLNPERIDVSDKTKLYTDCDGISKHSLPLVHGKEGVYTVLIDVLNYIQQKVNKKVVITCGSRCPKHNTYADISGDSKNSKHMIGAEVDFYVLGYEQKPEKIIDIILEFYGKSSKYKSSETSYIFKKNEDGSSWKNKEISISLCKHNQKRDFDNRHPYPYISIEVLWDRITGERVVCNLEKANKSYLQ
ncbi:MAG: D-Ala-D-Ala carboxypeptidase family metallohydrolase [Parachlamydiales bacterium]|jgi:hypothetical protein